MKRKIKYLATISIIPIFLLTGCMGGGKPFNIAKFMQNPFVMGFIMIIVLWYAFTHFWKK